MGCSSSAARRRLRSNAASHPNHHLIVHVYDAASGKAVTNATVTISYATGSGRDAQPADRRDAGDREGAAINALREQSQPSRRYLHCYRHGERQHGHIHRDGEAAQDENVSPCHPERSEA